MSKRIYLLLLLLALLVVPAWAQDTPLPAENAWTVSLYDQATGTVTRVAPGGDVVSEFVLPIPETFDTHSWDIATSLRGNFVAYVVSQVGDGQGATFPSQLIVYDVVNMSMAVNYDLMEGTTQESINAAAGSLAFNNEGTLLFTSYYVPTDESAQSYTMELTALDLTTGQVFNTLGNDALAAAGANEGSAYHVEVIAFMNNVATLLLSPVFVAEQLPPLALSWDVATNELTPASSELTDARDYFAPSAEVLLLTYDESLGTPVEQGEGVPAPANTVKIMNLTSGDIQTVYISESNLIDAMFVQNGERILVFTDPDATAVLIERDGTVAQELPDVPLSSNLHGSPEGIVYADPQSASAITGVTTSGDSFAAASLFTPAAAYTSISVQDYLSVPITPADEPAVELTSEAQ